ncbi:MAG: cobalamin-dependent protein [Polyangiaceae bacterium]|nr:cobalamin-dependent protein [Polyangiaceae bacterium]
MRVALVGPEIEENLALRYIAASLEAAGHEARLFDFHRAEQTRSVAAAIVAYAPELVGLSMIFTLRAREFVAVARELRALGYAGHVTAGGHFAALHPAELLAEGPWLDSVIAGEGEAPMVELARSLHAPERVAGLSRRDAAGSVVCTPPRPNSRDLDDRPWPTRPERFHAYLGQPIANLLSSRGCYANCSFCSIHAFHRDNGGMRFRQRAVTAVADEMAHLYHARGVRIFNFQDDNLLMPRARDNLARFGELGRALEARGVRQIGLQAKGRPDSIDAEVIDLLASLGLFRMFLGVETDAVSGLRTLGRGATREDNHRALEVLRARAIHTCFNLLVFDPDSSFEAVRQNLDFMRRQSYFPLNFCRVEIYSGTPLEQRLRAEGRLLGDHYGYAYAIREPGVQLAYELFRAVFWARNFGTGGLHHESMKLDYKYHLLAHFWPERASRALEHQVKGLVFELNRHSAALMGRIVDFAEADAAPSPEVRARLRAELGAEREHFDRELGGRIDAVEREVEALAVARPARRRARKVASAAAAGAALLATACHPHGDTHMCEMAPPPIPTTAPVGPAAQRQVEATIQERVNAELQGIIVQAHLEGVPIQLALVVAPAGELVDCQGLGGPTAEVARQLCERLMGMRLPAAVRTDGLVSRFSVAVQWPPAPAFDPDTHMCEMAPAPLD